jgi:dolichyl-phosphate-mannose--protein O-mannosyl transferase
LGVWLPGSDRAAAIAITLIALALRLAGVAHPDEIVFDEVYYAQDACWYLYASPARCGVEIETSRSHPPLGKWLIAGGIRLFGYHPLGWRIPSVLAGTLTVLLLYLLARRLLRSTMAASLAAGLLALDHLHFVHSRVAMLDIFLTLFIVAAMLCLVRDRDDLVARSALPGAPASLAARLWRPWRVAAGVAAGLAVATKLPGIYVVGALVALTVLWEACARGSLRPATVWRALREEGASICLYLVVVPAAIYALSYLGRLPGALTVPPWQSGSFLRAVASRQLAMLRFHVGYFGDHPYQSPAWSWLLLKRPIVYFFNESPQAVREILALGSPLIWWPSLAAAVYVGVRAVRHGRADGPELPILAGIAATYGPWLLLARSRSFVFLYYVLPTIPFLCLALAYVVQTRRRTGRARALAAAMAAAALAGFMFYYPVMTARPLAREAWRARIGLFSRCAPASPGQEQSSTTPADRPGPPPRGWCWR